MTPEKNPRSKDENQQQTQPTFDVGSGNRTRATLVEGECSHHIGPETEGLYCFYCTTLNFEDYRVT